MTTPLNLTLAPFGMDWIFRVGFIVFLAGVCCAKTIGVAAKNSARPQTRTSGLSLMISSTFIFYSPPPLQQGLQRIITDSLFATSSLGRSGEGSKIVIKTVAEINTSVFLKLRSIVNPLKRLLD